MNPLLVTVDAFTDAPFCGNPAAVCIARRRMPRRWMQALAREMNLSETAFVHLGDAQKSLRWFTPEVEVDLCGHATLASAYALWKLDLCPERRPLRFETRSGPLTCTLRNGWVGMDFPAMPCGPTDLGRSIGLMIGAEVVDAGFNGMDFLVEVVDEGTLRRLRPDLVRVAKLPARGLIVTARSEAPEFDFVSRFFAPAAGIDEDPVTGSAHCALGPYWAAKLGGRKFCALQASRRGGIVHVEMRRAGRVCVSGQAVMVTRVELSAEAALGAFRRGKGGG